MVSTTVIVFALNVRGWVVSTRVLVCAQPAINKVGTLVFVGVQIATDF